MKRGKEIWKKRFSKKKTKKTENVRHKAIKEKEKERWNISWVNDSTYSRIASREQKREDDAYLLMSKITERHSQVAENEKYMSKLMTEMKRNRNRIRVSENNSSNKDSYKPACTSNERSVASL